MAPFLLITFGHVNYNTYLCYIKSIMMKPIQINEFKNVISNPNDRDTYRRYLNEIAKYKPLTREEEFDLFEKIKNGDEQAAEKMCKHNLLFAVSMAKRYSTLIGKSTLALEDLISEGNLGICLAVKRFDNTSGNKFISYAVWWVRQCILECINKNIKNIRLPINVSESINKLKKVESKLEQQFGREVSTSELYEAMIESGDMTNLGASENKIEEWYKMSGFEYSLDYITNDETQSKLSDFIKSEDDEPDDVLIEKERYELLDAMMELIPRETVKYLTDFYGLGGVDKLSLKDISIKYNEPTYIVKARMDRALRQIRRANVSAKNFFFPTPNYEDVREHKRMKWDKDTVVLL